MAAAVLLAGLVQMEPRPEEQNLPASYRRPLPALLMVEVEWILAGHIDLAL